MVLRAKVFSSYQTFSQQMETYIVSTPAVESAATSAALVMANPHRVLTVTGVGLTYDIQGRINGGTVTGVEIEVEGNVKVMEIDGFSLNVAALNGALNAALEANPVWDFDASESLQPTRTGKGRPSRARAAPTP